MKRRRLRTSDISTAVGVHPNTVRLYEEWGYLPPIPRSPSGYRLFTEEHLAQMRLARLTLDTPWPGRDIRQSAAALVRLAAAGDSAGAMRLAQRHLAQVQAEQTQAEAAAELLERWAQGSPEEKPVAALHIGRAAMLLNVTPDTLRNWERNGLLRVPRDPHNGYRLFGAYEIGRLRVIRMLLRAGYSTMAVLRMMRQLDQGQHTGLRDVLDTPRPDEEIFYAADQWLSTLARQEQRALEIIDQLERMMLQQQT